MACSHGKAINEQFPTAYVPRLTSVLFHQILLSKINWLRDLRFDRLFVSDGHLRSFNQSQLQLECKFPTPSDALSDRVALQYPTGVYTLNLQNVRF